MLSGDAQAFDRELTDGLEVAVEVSDGTGYREPDNARFVITGRSGKTDDRTRTVTYSGQSISWLLSKAENNDSSHLLTDGDNKGKRPFYSANPGTILKTLLDENKARGGVATGLTLGFDTARDAGGAAWARKYTLYLQSRHGICRRSCRLLSMVVAATGAPPVGRSSSGMRIAPH